MKRKEDVDILRGIGIILVVMGHIGFGKPFDIWVHGFHMPLFYIISGYFFNPYEFNLGVFLKRKTKSLLVPCLVFATVGVLLSFVKHNMNFKYLESKVIDVILRPNINLPATVGALWFLIALFWINILFYCICRCFKNKGDIILVSIIMGLIGMLITQRFELYFYLGLDTAIAGMAFMGTGYMLKELTKMSLCRKCLNMKSYILVLLFIFNVFFIFSNKYVNYRSCIFNNVITAYINAVTATIIFWNISNHIENICDKRKFSLVIVWIKKIGENSIIFVCIHQLVYTFVYHAVMKVEVLADNPIWYEGKKVIELLLTIGMTYMIGIMIKKMKLQFIIGK